MYFLKDLRVTKLPRRFRCMFSRGRTLADVAIARKNVGYGQWFYMSKKVLFTAIENADESLKKEIYELVKPPVVEMPLPDINEFEEQEVIENNQEELNLIYDNIDTGEAKLEDLSLTELFAFADKLEIKYRKDCKKETMLKKINAKLGEQND